MFQSNAGGRGSRHCFSMFYGHRTLFSSLFFVFNRHSGIMITPADFQMCQGFRAQRESRYGSAQRTHGFMELLVHQLIFRSLSFLQLVSFFLELLFCAESRTRNKGGKNKLSLLSFFYNEKPAKTKNQTNEQTKTS